MRRRHRSPPPDILPEEDQEATINALSDQAASSALLAGKAAAALLLLAITLYSARAARRWELSRLTADALDALAVASLVLSAWAAATGSPSVLVAPAGVIASALQASALVTVRAPAPRVGWRVVVPLAAAAAAPAVGTAVVAALRRLRADADAGLDQLKRARYRHRTV